MALIILEYNGLKLYVIFSWIRMSDRSSQSRVLSMVQESYNSGSPEDLRQLEEREYVMRLKQDIEQRQLAYAYRSKGA